MKTARSLLFGIPILFATMPWSSAISGGDPVAGEAKTSTCVACHAKDGNGIANPNYPKIGGQVRGYVATALADYKSGQRADPVMASMVASLTEQDMQDLDAYYAQFDFSLASISEDDVPAAERGRELYRGGQSQYSVPACMACHGPSGKGIPTRFPRVSGQQVEYLIKSLMDYKSGIRFSDEMNPIAFRLTDDQIEDLAIYMHGLN